MGKGFSVQSSGKYILDSSTDWRKSKSFQAYEKINGKCTTITGILQSASYWFAIALIGFLTKKLFQLKPMAYLLTESLG